MSDTLDYERGHQLLQNLIRGDATIGLISDVPAMEKQILSLLWSSASQGNAKAFRSLADCALASLQTIGAFEGIYDEDAESRPWSDGAKEIENDDEQLQTGLRALFEAQRLGDHEALIRFAKITRHSPDHQPLAAKLLRDKQNPSGDELYVLGNVLLWLGQKEESAKAIHRAADLGNLDAKFELSLYYGQGLGVEVDAARAQQWLDTAADAGHYRALYNVGSAYASGQRGEPDLAKAAEFYKRAAEAGHARAACTLGVMILNGELQGTKDEAIHWLNTSDELGYPTWEMLDAAGVDDPRDE